MDTVVIESAKDSTLLQPANQKSHTFSPILEADDAETVSTNPFESPKSPKISNLQKTATNTSKPSLKGSKVSFEQPGNESDDSFEERREHFQQKKSLSATDRKGILKVSIYAVFVCNS